MLIRRKKWLQQDDESLIELKSVGYKNKDIGKFLGRTEAAINSRLTVLKVGDETLGYKKTKYNQNEIAYLVLNHNKFSNNELAKNLGRTKGSVSGTISRLKSEGVIIEPKHEPKQMDLITQVKPLNKPKVNTVNDNLSRDLKALKLENKWLASLCIINFIGVVIIAVSSL